MKNQEEIDLHWIFLVIRRWWWLIVGCTLLAGITAFWVMSSRDPSFEATATLLVSPGQDSRMSEYNTLVAGERLALTYIEMLKSPTILGTVVSRLGLHISSDALAKKIQASTVKDTQLIRLTAKDPSPEQAALLANTIAETFTAHIQKLQSIRYTTSLASLQKEIDTLSAGIEDTQAQINALNASKIKDAARLANLETMLSEQRSDYRTLEQDYQEMKLTISQLTDIVQVVEPAQAAGNLNQATLTLLVGRASNASSTDIRQLIETYREMLVGRPVLEAAIARLGLQTTPEALMANISVQPVTGTQLIRLNVVGGDTTKAAMIANTIADIFIANVRNLLEAPYTDRLAAMQKQLADLSVQIKTTQAEIDALTTSSGQTETERVRQETLLEEQRSDYQALKNDYNQLNLIAANAAEVVSITEPAQVPNKLANTNDLLYTAIAAMAGAALALGSVFLFESLNDTLRSELDVNRALGLNPLGTIGHLGKGESGPVILAQPLSPQAEAFRKLAANLRYTGLDRPLQTLLVTSPNPQEGKSTVVANLAAALALKELRVVVVDADLRRPQVHHIFGVPQSDGLTDALLQSTLNGQLRQAEPVGLKILTSGEIPPNPAEVVGSSRMHSLLEELQQKVDMVLIDCPPVLPVADATLLAPHVDGVLVVLRANHTSSQTAVQAIESLQKVGAHIVGVVLNGMNGGKTGYHNYYSTSDGKKNKGWLARLRLGAHNHAKNSNGKKA